MQRNERIYIVDGQEFTREEIKKMIEILSDLIETSAFEFPYRVPDLQSRAHTLLSKSKK